MILRQASGIAVLSELLVEAEQDMDEVSPSRSPAATVIRNRISRWPPQAQSWLGSMSVRIPQQRADSAGVDCGFTVIYELWTM